MSWLPVVALLRSRRQRLRLRSPGWSLMLRRGRRLLMIGTWLLRLALSKGEEKGKSLHQFRSLFGFSLLLGVP